MLSMEAFLSLYDSTKDPKWLERAQTAANFAESWIWIWTVPMPLDADNAQLYWKKSAPAIGFQGITAMNSGSVDEYLDWAVPSYAKLYNLTKDPHYLDVARVLLHDTKSMVALPGTPIRHEWHRLAAGRLANGAGRHRARLSADIGSGCRGFRRTTSMGSRALEEYDPALFKNLSAKPEAAPETTTEMTEIRGREHSGSRPQQSIKFATNRKMQSQPSGRRNQCSDRQKLFAVCHDKHTC